MTTPDTTPLSAQLIELEQQAARLEHHEAVIANLNQEIEELQQKKADAMRALTVSLSARDRLGSIGAIIAPFLHIHTGADAAQVATRTVNAADYFDGVAPMHHVSDVAAQADTQQEAQPTQDLPTLPVEPVPVPTWVETPTQVTTEPAEVLAAPAVPTPRTDVSAPGLEHIEASDLPNRLQILLFVARHPGATAVEIIEQTALPKGTVGSTLSVYATQRLIAREGTPYRHRATSSGVKVLLDYADTMAQTPDSDTEDSEEPGQPSSADPEAVTPEPAPAPAAPARPDPESVDGRALAYLDARGPSVIPPIAAHLNVTNGLAGMSLHRLLVKGLVERINEDQPYVYRVPGDTRPQVQFEQVPAKKPEAPRQPGSGVIAPTEILEQRVKNCAVVKTALTEAGKAMTENDLIKATGLALSHLRTAVQMLTDDNVIVREDGSGFGVRATYRLEDITSEIPMPQADHLTDLGRKVEQVLLLVTDRGGKESITNLAVAAYVSREDVVEALGVLHYHQSRLRWTRVGSLLLFQVAPAADEVAA
ncbi:MarR family transcriptional regulator [Deinococcus grandis]|uniref:MarR family transcriptional regulator n=1 Tax=Deinococcus grandis TaxID=57498 RepID=UPI00073E33E6|nr:helix-turn-helix domain-containing protein [Deinococcus grandis]